MRSRYVGAALLGAVALSMGCGLFNSDNKAGNSAAGQPPASAAPTAGSTGGNAGGGSGIAFGQGCPTSAVVGGLLGMTFKGDPQVTKGTDAIVCTYTGTRDSDKAPEFVLVNMRTGTEADMARTRQQEIAPAVSQSGIGDEAYSFQTQSIGSTLTNLVARKGNRIVQIGGEATMAQLTAVVNMLLAL